MYDPLMIDAWNINVLMGRFLQFQVAMSTQHKMCWLQQDTRSHTPRMPSRQLAAGHGRRSAPKRRQHVAALGADVPGGLQRSWIGRGPKVHG